MSNVVKTAIKKIVTAGESLRGALSDQAPIIHRELIAPKVKSDKVSAADWEPIRKVLTEYVTDAYISAPRKVKGERRTSADMRSAIASGKGELNNAVKSAIRVYVANIRNEVSAQFGLDIDTGSRGTKARAEGKADKADKAKGEKKSSKAKGEPITRTATFSDVLAYLDQLMTNAKPNQVRVDCAELQNRIKVWKLEADSRLAMIGKGAKPEGVAAH